MVLTTVTHTRLIGEFNEFRRLAISFAFHNITSRFFIPECLPIADFTESLFNNQNVDLVSVTFDRVNMESDGKDLLMNLLNVPDLKIKNSRIIIPILKELQFD